MKKLICELKDTCTMNVNECLHKIPHSTFEYTTPLYKLLDCTKKPCLLFVGRKPICIEIEDCLPEELFKI